MTSEAAPQGDRVRADFVVEGEHFRLQFQATVPAGPTRAGELLPIARALSDVIVDQACRAAEASGATISCTHGCAACCRGLISISHVEARRIRAVVENAPEPRRAAIHARFAAVREQLEQAGLLEKLRAAESWTAAEYTMAVDACFALGIACPFLEAESCSIYDERPITCREYLVTSPPARCANLASEGVRRVELPVHLFNAVARWQAPSQGHFLEQWVPLLLALEWAEAHPDDPPPKAGLALLQDLLAQLHR